MLVTIDLVKKHFFDFYPQDGQALLLVVLVMVISLTVGLSAVTRSITNVRTSTQDENSQRAFSAAEAGIQQELSTGNSTSDISFNTNQTNVKANISTQYLQGSQVLVNNGDAVPDDQGADVWLVSHDSSGKPLYNTVRSEALTIYWGSNSTACSNAAIEVVLLSGSSVNAAVSNHYVYDPCTSRGNNLTNLNGSALSTPFSIGSQTFYYSLAIPPVANGFLMRVIPLYSSTPIGVTGSNLPQQGTKITSTGSAGPTGAPIQRQVVYYQGYPELPVELFPYVLFVNPN
jgi:Tfp pilus assembly protein PilX